MTAPKSNPAPGKTFRKKLLDWYGTYRRDLPWRRTRDPYAIWISEIMLQQTRVVAVIDYYQRFLDRFPTVQSLAAAREQDVLAAWSGLGYYRRARFLHAAAKKIVDELGGHFPTTSEDLRNLPGVGRYTSAAIASIAFGEPVAVVDGNVERVLERVDGKQRSGESVWTRAQELLEPLAAGDWNQAMMELGATICTPVAPLCSECPVNRWCTLPGHDVRKPQAERRKRELVYGIARRGKKVLLRQRPKGESLMPGMWELPMLESAGERPLLVKVKHSITTSDYAIAAVEMSAREVVIDGRWFSREELHQLPLTGVARKVLRKLELF